MPIGSDVRPCRYSGPTPYFYVCPRPIYSFWWVPDANSSIRMPPRCLSTLIFTGCPLGYRCRVEVHDRPVDPLGTPLIPRMRRSVAQGTMGEVSQSSHKVTVLVLGLQREQVWRNLMCLGRQRQWCVWRHSHTEVACVSPERVKIGGYCKTRYKAFRSLGYILLNGASLKKNNKKYYKNCQEFFSRTASLFVSLNVPSTKEICHRYQI